MPTDEQYAAILACADLWCAGEHHQAGAAQPERWNFGLMKFGAELLRRVPVEPISERLGDDRRWQRVDLALYSAIATAGREFIGPEGNPEPHIHGPAGRHLHHEVAARAARINQVTNTRR